jgi:hypothetical protein
MVLAASDLPEKRPDPFSASLLRAPGRNRSKRLIQASRRRHVIRDFFFARPMPIREPGLKRVVATSEQRLLVGYQ